MKARFCLFLFTLLVVFSNVAMAQSAPAEKGFFANVKEKVKGKVVKEIGETKVGKALNIGQPPPPPMPWYAKVGYTLLGLVFLIFLFISIPGIGEALDKASPYT